MGTGGGYLFSALVFVKEGYGCSEDALMRGIFVAAGMKTVIPYDGMVLALDKLGRGMPPELLCTSKGGCCTTPTAKRCKEEFEKADKDNVKGLIGK